jgi:uncharacterized SAM-binding protein YcdF (DUF218 family)
MKEFIFVAQKVALILILPASSALLLWIAGLLLWKRRRVACFLFAAGLVWLFVACLPVAGLLLMQKLEDEAGPYADPAALSAKGARHIVVLSGGFREGDLTPADRIGCSILRVMEAVRLWRAMPSAKIVLTGGVIPGLNREVSLAAALADVTVGLGVPREKLILESDSWTTEDQAEMARSIVGTEPFALVTSAYHMPRSLMLFRRAGLAPLPAPADFTARRIPLDYSTLLPQADGLWLMQTVVKEYAVRWAQMVLGQGVN